MSHHHNRQSRRPAPMRRNSAVLVSVKNDAESEVIVRLAEMLGMMCIVSNQGVGATLDSEPDIIERIGSSRAREVWTVEIPGPDTEELLRAMGYRVVIIDHHVYTNLKLDRMREDDGSIRPSSLEQFLKLAEVSDQDLCDMEFDPKTVRGIGIYDAGAGKALRAAGYKDGEMRQVLMLVERIKRATNPHYGRDASIARRLWRERGARKHYSVIIATGNWAPSVIDAALWDAIEHGHRHDESPIVLTAKDGLVTTVRHVSAAVIDHLNVTIRDGWTFVFGADNCWGVDNRKDKRHVPLEEVLAALETAPW